jgi:hypothetical protein
MILYEAAVKMSAKTSIVYKPEWDKLVSCTWEVGVGLCQEAIVPYHTDFFTGCLSVLTTWQLVSIPSPTLPMSNPRENKMEAAISFMTSFFTILDWAGY